MAVDSSVGIFNFEREKICDLYESQHSLDGQAYEIKWTKNYDGIPSLTFKIPYRMASGEKNFRWDYLKNEYLVRVTRGEQTEWFIANKPVKSKSGKEIVGNVTCIGFASMLKTKNIYMEFDDTNGIGILSDLLAKVLAGTGWGIKYCPYPVESDGTTAKVRSLKSGNKQGALGLINSLCNIFRCHPEYDSENLEISLYENNIRDSVMELQVGRNAESISIDSVSDDIVTRLYVEGEYAEDGYVGIDELNNGLNYIMNFDYYKSIGMFTETHQDALDTYITRMTRVKANISDRQNIINGIENSINDRIGQCMVALYYRSNGFTTPTYTYGDPDPEQSALNVNDKVIIINENKDFVYATIATTPQALLQEGDYAIVKFITPAAGRFGAGEDQIKAKEKLIENLQEKINGETKTDKIKEYNKQIKERNSQIEKIYKSNRTILDQLMRPKINDQDTGGLLYRLDYHSEVLKAYLAQQDNYEVEFIITMGNMLRDGYWQNNNYVLGQESALYADALEMSEQMAKPKISYSVKYIRSPEEADIPIDDLKLNQVARILDDDLETYDNLFIKKIEIGIDNDNVGNIEVSNDDLTLQTNDLSSILSRMSQLADLIDQKNALYDRAKAIQKNGSIYTDRLNGQINVLKTQFLSTVSNWYTDERGNIMFESADGGSAMMLCGAGFMIANGKDESDNWNWRTFGDGTGFTADEIVAGFISAERIEAGSIEANKLASTVGAELDISSNTSLNLNIESIAGEKAAEAKLTAQEFTVMFNNTVADGIQDGIDGANQNINDYKNTVGNYMTFGSNGVLTLGNKNNPFKTKLSSTKLSFYEGSSEVAYISNKSMYISQARIVDFLTFGKANASTYFQWEVTSGNGLGLKWMS